MCFIIHPKYPNIKIANRDIVCYKYGYSYKTVFRSRFYGFNYGFGKVYSQGEKWWPQVKYGIKEYYIEKGFHSYSNKKMNVGMDRNKKTKVKCIIPKGSKYYYNPDRKEYVSNQIIIKEII